MDTARLQLVRVSYTRCCLDGLDFFDTFYTVFLGASAEIRQAFAKTDMARQKAMLRDSLSMVLAFAQGRPYARSSIERLGAVHSRARNNVPPRLYALWVDSLIATLQRHDKEFTPELEVAWREAVAPALEALAAAYEGGGRMAR